jgi:hypothetical protein
MLTMLVAPYLMMVAAKIILPFQQGGITLQPVLSILIKKGRGIRPNEALATLTSYSLV